MLRINQLSKCLGQMLLVTLFAGLLTLTGLFALPVNAAPANPSDRSSDVMRASDTTFKGRQIIQDTEKKPNAETLKTIKQIQQEAEDLGDSPERPIGDTGLENIRELGENIPETINMKLKQTRQIYAPKDAP